MKKVLFVLLGLMLFVLAGCSNSQVSDKKLAEDYVKSKGYDIESDGNVIETYTLGKNKMQDSLETLHYQQIWSVQETEPDQYFGEEISTYCFIVNNHPLGITYSVDTNVFVMISEGKIIGGYSFPDTESYGSVYSFDGKTLEEMTGLNYEEWKNNWTVKYGN